MKKMSVCLFLIFSLFASSEKKDSQIYSFKEVWAYVMKGEESWIEPQKPVTDVAYFSAVVGETGRISTNLDATILRKNVPPKSRVHCVISAPANRSLMYWCLSKDKETKQGLIEDILRISSTFDGVQIDFEGIRNQDGDAYCSFLEEIRKGLPKEKIMSVALPARVKEVQDAFPYEKIGKIADKVLIMAYDEHWRTGPPGSIASANWCKNVCRFAKEKIPANKLIMGIPLYGRVWQKQEVARALKYFQTLDLWKEVGTLVHREADGTPYFGFKQKIDAVVFYEDVTSLQNKFSC